MTETVEKGGDVEARKVNQQTFAIIMAVISAVFIWVQWGMNVQSNRISDQDKRIALAEQKADSAEKAAVSYNLSLSIQLANVQSDVKWIREKLGELKVRP
jgi:hypothetical protein